MILGVCGSIAAYKAADIVSRLVKRGYDVHVVLTENAAKFIGPLTFQTLSRNPVTTGVLSESADWKPEHIALADRAALFLIAPATANVIAKLACGIADDAITSIALATVAPILIAPAMNGKMWLHPATQENVSRLVSRGVHFIGPEEGLLACGYEGLGRLWNTEQIAANAEKFLSRIAQNSNSQKIAPKKIKRKLQKFVD